MPGLPGASKRSRYLFIDVVFFGEEGAQTPHVCLRHEQGLLGDLSPPISAAGVQSNLEFLGGDKRSIALRQHNNETHHYNLQLCHGDNKLRPQYRGGGDRIQIG